MTYSTKQAARLAGIHWVTLLRWISSGKFRPSKSLKLNGGKVWLWTAADVQRLRRYKSAHYWGGRGGRKPKGGRGKISRSPHRSRKKETKQ